MIIMEAGTTGVETIVFGDILENVKRNESGNIRGKPFTGGCNLSNN